MNKALQSVKNCRRRRYVDKKTDNKEQKRITDFT